MNNVNLIGNLGKAPVVKYSDEGICKAYFSLGVHGYSSKEKKKFTDWIDVHVKGKQAEIVGNNLDKGSLISVTGALKSYITEREGIKVKCTYVLITGNQGKIKFLSLKKINNK